MFGDKNYFWTFIISPYGLHISEAAAHLAICDLSSDQQLVVVLSYTDPPRVTRRSYWPTASAMPAASPPKPKRWNKPVHKKADTHLPACSCLPTRCSPCHKTRESPMMGPYPAPQAGEGRQQAYLLSTYLGA